MRSTTTVAKGYVLHETNDIAVIATTRSMNRKTGDMIQVWILNRHESPIASVKSGTDSNICFDCPHRGNGFKERTCYVNVGQGPNSVWRAYRAGRYPHLPLAEYARVFGSRKVRLGAYGDPVLIPLAMIDAVTRASEGWTGYTHQWRRPEFAEYRAYVMASCDSEFEANTAAAAGWRYFRVRSESARLLPGEISCPASEESGHKTTCEHCRLCNGARSADQRKNIAIIVHGSGAKNFVSVDAIAAAA